MYSVIALILVILILIIYNTNSHSENIMSPGYVNRMDVSAHINQTYGGTDAQVSKDPRFGV